MAAMTSPAALLADRLQSVGKWARQWAHARMEGAGTLLRVVRQPRAAEGTYFTILVARIARDDGDGRRVRLLSHLQRLYGGGSGGTLMRIVAHPDVLTPGTDQAGIEATGRTKDEWLAGANADLLIWGEADDADHAVRLHLYTGQGAADPAHAYTLSERMELLPAFAANLGGALANLAAACIVQTASRPGGSLAGNLAVLADKLRPLAANPPAGFQPYAQAQLQHIYALSEMRLGQERGESHRIEIAVEYFRKALAFWSRENAPSDWPTAQNNLGTALCRLGENESGTARLHEAVAVFRKVLEVWTRQAAPLDWATTQNNLGTALSGIGDRESGTARLEEAVQAYRAALEERTRERVPLQWAATQNNLGTTLSSIGERESGTEHLEKSVLAYRAALEEWTRERVPLDWARAQNNLGTALAGLGEREDAAPRLEEAVCAFRAALTEWTRQRAPLDWARAQNNLGTALAGLGERENGIARLEEAAFAFREALKEWTRERAPLDWAATHNNLGAALRALGERQAETDYPLGCRTLQEARQAVLAALEVFRTAEASHYIPQAETNLARIEGSIARIDPAA